LAGIAGSLATEELTARALEGLALWRQAMAAYHQAGPAQGAGNGTTKKATVVPS
jgi:hypothetical protein